MRYIPINITLIARTSDNSIKLDRQMLCNHTCSRSIESRKLKPGGGIRSAAEGEWRRGRQFKRIAKP